MQGWKDAVHLRQFLSEDRAREFEQTFAATIKLSGLAKDCLSAGDTEGRAHRLKRRRSETRCSGPSTHQLDTQREPRRS